MELTKDEIIQKNAKKCGHCNRDSSLPYEDEWTCLSCGFNIIKRKKNNSLKYNVRKLIISID